MALVYLLLQQGPHSPIFLARNFNSAVNTIYVWSQVTLASDLDLIHLFIGTSQTLKEMLFQPLTWLRSLWELSLVE